MKDRGIDPQLDPSRGTRQLATRILRGVATVSNIRLDTFWLEGSTPRYPLAHAISWPPALNAGCTLCGPFDGNRSEGRESVRGIDPRDTLAPAGRPPVLTSFPIQAIMAIH